MSDQRTTRAERPARPPEDGGDENRPRRRPQERNEDGGERRRPPRRDEEEDDRHGASEREGDGDRPRRSSQERRPLDALAASRLALDALQQLTSKAAEGVIGVEREDDGSWIVVVELLETSRIPNTSDVLGEYEVEIGPDRALRSYTRRSRYTRGSTMTGD